MFRHLLRDRRGAIAILSAFVLVGVIGVSALAVEFGRGLLRRAENQKIADIAATSGALVYNSTGSSSSASGAVGNIVALNGLSSNAVTSQIVNSPSGDGNQAVEVTVTTSDPLMLARVLTPMASLSVSATAYAEVKAGAPACIIALSSSGSGITLSGTGSISAPGCAVASNSAVTCAETSDNITTPILGYNSGSAPTAPPCAFPTSTPRMIRASTADPLSGNANVAAATARLSTVAAIVSPSVTGGTDIKFGYNASSIKASLPSGCSIGSATSPPWNVTCSGATSFTFGNIVLQGGVTVNFNTSGASDITYYFGKGSQSCSGIQGYSICNTGTALNMGPGTYVLAGGIYNGGGATLTIGSGNSSNSFQIGAASDGNSINVSTSKSTTLGDATGSGDVFETAGNIASGGGTCLTLSAAAEHDINGYILLAGGTTLGAGTWTVSDYVSFGANNGGDVTCNGTSIGVSGSNVTLVIGGAATVSCNGKTSTFCVGNGFANVDLTAPSSGSTANLLVIGPTSSGVVAGAAFTQGASGTTLAGAFYFPQGPVSLNGDGQINNPPNDCLELIGANISVTNGGAVGTDCKFPGETYVGQGVALVE